jgi:ribulose-phosphate 3-epimerase
MYYTSMCIIPAIIPTSEQDVAHYARELAFSPELHLDVVDGIFVPSVSWPYKPKGSPHTVAHWLDFFSLEVDLMVADPLTAAQQWLEAGADALVFHIETISLEDFILFSKRIDISIGVSAHMGTSMSLFEPYIAAADYVQIMGIAQIGSQGQPFDSRAFDYIQMIRTEFPKLPISIDGSVNMKTLPGLAVHHLDRYIVGSAIVGQDDPEFAYRTLQTYVDC